MGFRSLGPVVLAIVWISSLAAQDLSPRAYLITPVNSNAVNLTYGFYTGGVNFNGSVPITGAMGTYSVPVFSLYHSFSFYGHSANISGGLPYGVGNFSGNQARQQKSIYRSGLLDFYARLSVNLIGGPAMQPKEFREWKQKVILGASLKILAPTGQYDPTKLVNWGINRWAFKPEIGYSERWGNWILDAYGAVWFYTTNPDSFNIPHPAPQTEEPIGSFEGHLSYDLSREKTTKKLKPWVSLDGNFWWGGITSLSGIRNVKTEQTSSRIGGTFALPLRRHQLLKVAYSDGTYIRFGGNYQNVQVGWQYTWVGTHIR
jgi:hypothetical protein